MDHVNRALQAMADGLGPYLPRLLGALAILAAAWLGARLVRAALLRATQRAGLDERLHNPGLGALLADIGHWLVWLLALPALLDALQLKGLLDPVNAMLARLLGFLPNLLGAVVILGVGLLVAGIVRRILTGVLTAAGSEKLAARLGLSAALGERTLAGLAATAVFALMLLPTLAASLQALGLDAITRPVSLLLDSVVGLIPRLVTAALILVVAALIGRALASLVSGVLSGLGADRLPATLGWQGEFNPGGRGPSELLGNGAMVVVLFIALAQASEVLGLPLLTQAVATLGGVLVNLALALLVLGVGLWLAQLAARMVLGGGSPQAAGLARLVRGAVICFTVALALRQAGLPAEIVALAFGALVCGLALGLALAIGLGGQRLAGKLLERAALRWQAAGHTARPDGASQTPPHGAQATTEAGTDAPASAADPAAPSEAGREPQSPR